MSTLRTGQAYVRWGCGALLFLIAVAYPMGVSAHVKWFANYNENMRPIPFSDVATPSFLLIYTGFVVIFFLGLLADAWLTKRWPGLTSAGETFLGFQEKWVRLGVGAFLLCMWSSHLNILTAELHTKMAWVFTIQFISAFCIAWRRTCILSSFGICVLYLYALTQYGFFHMLDYVYFLGLAVFLAGVTLPKLAQIRVQVMTAALAFSVMWTAIEKFVYPQWTNQVLQAHPGMAVGLPFSLVIIIAGFVEFTLAFYLVIGRGLLRVGSLILLLVFVVAMPEFGYRDVVGHIPLVAILMVPFVGGDTTLQRFWRLRERPILSCAALACVLYTASLMVFFLAYYGVQWMEYPHAGV